VNGTCRKLCDADRRVLEGVLRLMKGERYAGEPVWSIRYVTIAILKWMRWLMGSQWCGCYCWIIENNFCRGVLNSLLLWSLWTYTTDWTEFCVFHFIYFCVLFGLWCYMLSFK